MSQGKKKLIIGYAYDKSDLDPTKERFDDFIESLLPHHYTESNDSSEKTLSTEEELQQLRQTSRDAIQKSWKEVENLQEECVKSCDTISHLSSDLHESRDALSKAKERIIKLEKELKYYHEIPDVLTKMLDERRKRMSLEFKSTIGDYKQQPQRRSQSASMMTHSHHDISNDASSEPPRRASIPLFTRISPSYRMFPTKRRESIISAITVGGSTSSSTTINGDNDSSNNKLLSVTLSNDSPKRTTSNNDTNTTPTPAVTTITANHESSPSSAATTITPAATAATTATTATSATSATAASLRDSLNTCSQEDLDLKISSRNAAIATLEQTVQDNVGQVVQMDQELKRLRDLLSQNNIAYNESTNEIGK